MKTLKDTFEENYIAYEEPCDNKKGFRIAYRYIGLWYVYQLSDQERKRCKGTFLVCGILSTIFFLGGSLQNCQLNYVTLPMFFSMLSLAAFLFECIGVLRFCLSKEKLTKPDFEEINLMLQTAPIVHACLLVCSVAAGIYMILHDALPLQTFLVPICYLVSCACSFYIWKRYRSILVVKEKNV